MGIITAGPFAKIMLNQIGGFIRGTIESEALIFRGRGRIKHVSDSLPRQGVDKNRLRAGEAFLRTRAGGFGIEDSRSVERGKNAKTIFAQRG